jgi:hypothetical protein
MFSSRKEALKEEVRIHKVKRVNEQTRYANRARQKTEKFYFAASGQENPNYGGGNVSTKGRRAISTATTNRLLANPENNPFSKKGEESMSHGRKWVTNKDRSEEKYLRPGEDVPEGWSSGRKIRPPRSEESRQKTSETLKGREKSKAHRESLRLAALKQWERVKGKTPSD